MIKNVIYKKFKPLHPWRSSSFDELSEIYASMALRSFGFSLIGIFVPIYLYNLGISIQEILLFFVIFFAFRVPVDFISAFVVGRVGPKHSIAISTILYIFFLGLLLSLEAFIWPLWLLALFFSMSNGLFFVAYQTDFSKIKHATKGGSELGYLLIFERIGSAAGPLIGGLIATIFSPQITIYVAICFLFLSQIPLMLSKEPVRIHQQIKFKNFAFKDFTRDYISLSANGIDRVASIFVWPLLIAITVFTEATYAKLGFLTGFTVAFSILSANLSGRIIDNNKGFKLLSWSACINSVIHVLRPFSLNTFGAITISVVNEPVTLSYNMPLAKAYYDRADSIEGYRIVYLSVSEAMVAISKCLFFVGLFIFSNIFNPISVLQWSYIAVAILTLAVFMQKFPALKEA